MKKNREKGIGRACGRQLLAAVACLAFCAAAFCSATYAWFANDVENSGNCLATGRFELGVSVSGANESAVEVIKCDDGSFECELPAAGDYTVTLTMKDSTVSRGFCIIEVGDTKYTTNIIGKTKDESADVDPFVFKLKVTKATTVKFKPCWGFPSNHNIDNGGEIPPVGA